MAYDTKVQIAETTLEPGLARKPFEEEIRREAYYRYEWRCEMHETGSETGDWLAAEQAARLRLYETECSLR